MSGNNSSMAGNGAGGSGPPTSEAGAVVASNQAKATLNVQAEKPLHYTYLKEFRVEQCPQFLQHKCTQHKPFTCFHWHFMNQRRRRPIRDPKTKTFNYSPDMYCTKYDETTGICPDGDECPFLHRTAGDTERRYHLRYYKTGICVYDTDGRGHCVKNGPHCAFAHGLHDLRNPVYDIREIQGKILNDDGTEVDANGVLVTNSLDKDRNAISEDPRWQDTNYVLGNYKTEACKRPPRLCRQGYACPQYHNSRDKRRPPQKFKYRSTPCPNVKQGDEWGDPANCEGGDQCTYCHTRTEQQFHPEIYKSTKCNDMQQTSFCPRGPFCAFAHVDKEMSVVRELAAEAAGGTNLASILSNVLPPGPASSPNTSTSAGGGGQGSNKPPHENGSTPNSALELQQQQQHGFNMGPIGRPRSYSTSHAAAVQHHLQLKTMESALPHWKAPGCEREEQAMRKHRAKTMDGPHAKDWPSSLAVGYGFPNTVESVVGKALDEFGLEDIDVEACLDKDLVEECAQPNHNLNHVHTGHNHNHNPVASSLNQGLVNSGLIPHPTPNTSASPHQLQHPQLSGNNSQPVNIPGRERPSSPPSSLVGSIDKSAAAFYGSPFAAGFSGYAGGVSGAPPSPSSRLWPDSQPPGAPGVPVSGNNLSNMNSMNSGGMWNDPQIRAMCEAYKTQADEAIRREKIAEQQRDEALTQLQKLQMENQQLQQQQQCSTLGQMGLRQLDLEHLTPPQLRALQEQLRSELDTVDKVSQLQQERLRMAQQLAVATSQTGSQGGGPPGSQQRHLAERDYWAGPPGRGHC